MSLERPMLPRYAQAPRLCRILLRVRDPQRSAEFYRSVLGLESVPCRSNGRGVPSATDSAVARRDFEVVFTEGLSPGDHLIGLDRVSFEVPSRESVDRIYEQATQRNARATQPRLYEGHWQAFIFDPDGYKVEVFAQLHDAPAVSPPDYQAGDRGGRPAAEDRRE